MISIQALSKQFGDMWALNEVTINIKEGGFYGLLGPNGAGKTTALKIISGLMKPTKGKVFINNIDLDKEPLKIKKILGFVPDQPFLYENLTIQDFLDFVMDIFEVERKTGMKEIEYYFDIFRLKDYRDILIKELSHGMRQKLVYISNFIHHPLIYLIDEPLVGLDPYSIHLLKGLLKEETKKGRTILMCTHILSVAEELADRIGILKEGSLIAEGAPSELKEKLAASSLEDAFLKITKDLP